MEFLQRKKRELLITAHYYQRAHFPGIADAGWPIINSGVFADSQDPTSYYARFYCVMPQEESIISFESWVDNFQRGAGRKPLTLELMGNSHFISVLGLEGVCVNKRPEYGTGIYERGDRLVEVNCDMENLPVFFPLLDEAFSSLGQESGVDLIVWKGEGALGYMSPDIEAFEYWWNWTTNLLSSGGSAFIQHPFLMADGESPSAALEEFKTLMYAKGIAEVTYIVEEGERYFYMRIDKF